jgi:hypothetical protein
MENDIPSKWKPKVRRSKTEIIRRDKEGQCIMTKGSIHQEDKIYYKSICI